MVGRLLRYRQLKAEKHIPYCQQQLVRLEKANQFPRRVKLGPGTYVWVEAEIDEYLAAKLAERDQKAA